MNHIKGKLKLRDPNDIADEIITRILIQGIDDTSNEDKNTLIDLIDQYTTAIEAIRSVNSDKKLDKKINQQLTTVLQAREAIIARWHNRS